MAHDHHDLCLRHCLDFVSSPRRASLRLDSVLPSFGAIVCFGLPVPGAPLSALKCLQRLSAPWFYFGPQTQMRILALRPTLAPSPHDRRPSCGSECACTPSHRPTTSFSHSALGPPAAHSPAHIRVWTFCVGPLAVL